MKWDKILIIRNSEQLPEVLMWAPGGRQVFLEAGMYHIVGDRGVQWKRVVLKGFVSLLRINPRTLRPIEGHHSKKGGFVRKSNLEKLERQGFLMWLRSTKEEK